MIKPIDQLLRLMARFLNPVSLPEDVASDLGIRLSNFTSFDKIIECLSHPNCRPKSVSRYMPRHLAEQAFQKALRKERFHQNSLFSYYIHEGWMEFNLQFDNESRLRRIYIQHQKIKVDEGIEIQLENQVHSLHSL